ncbi:hypothetical protein G6F50_013378 [Rhizopus delemar]|uniref:Cas12f1-like TNB domain-containing protein n=1 Tax=Rhizopus delemar TaxID=936053 RepID=A0A9P6YJ17_9FUNG|nr:hypothetical protein G6F50_013378 [Rhizopus delemar]
MENNNNQSTTSCSSCHASLSVDSCHRTCQACREQVAAAHRRHRTKDQHEETDVATRSTLKTANLTSFLLAASTRLQNYQRIHNYYCQDKWSQKLKFKTYISNKKYGISSTAGAKNQNPNKSKHAPLPPADLPSSSQQKRITASGNSSFCSSIKGKRAAPTKRITEEIKRKCKQSNEGTEFIYVDEYLTSQICNKCKSKQLNNISIIGSKRRVYSVLKCESCGTVWNRDVNSALNI